MHDAPEFVAARDRYLTQLGEVFEDPGRVYLQLGNLGTSAYEVLSYSPGELGPLTPAGQARLEQDGTAMGLQLALGYLRSEQVRVGAEVDAQPPGLIEDYAQASNGLETALRRLYPAGEQYPQFGDIVGGELRNLQQSGMSTEDFLRRLDALEANNYLRPDAAETPAEQRFIDLLKQNLGEAVNEVVETRDMSAELRALLGEQNRLGVYERGLSGLLEEGAPLPPREDFLRTPDPEAPRPLLPGPYQEALDGTEPVRPETRPDPVAVGLEL